jgi:hypothetical protein
MSDYYQKLSPILTNLKFALEPLSIGLPNNPHDGHTLDLSFNVRSMDELENGLFHVSGFVFESLRGQERIAKLSGVSVDELMSRLAYCYGRAIAELNMVAGFFFTSTHGQNIRFEFDQNWKPTCQIVLPDLTDGQPAREIWEAHGQDHLLQVWDHFTKGMTFNESISISTASAQGRFLQWPQTRNILQQVELGMNSKAAEIRTLAIDRVWENKFKDDLLRYLLQIGSIQYFPNGLHPSNWTPQFQEQCAKQFRVMPSTPKP